jgi:hypothetical protein
MTVSTQKTCQNKDPELTEDKSLISQNILKYRKRFFWGMDMKGVSEIFTKCKIQRGLFPYHWNTKNTGITGYGTAGATAYWSETTRGIIFGLP